MHNHKGQQATNEPYHALAASFLYPFRSHDVMQGHSVVQRGCARGIVCTGTGVPLSQQYVHRAPLPDGDLRQRDLVSLQQVFLLPAR